MSRRHDFFSLKGAIQKNKHILMVNILKTSLAIEAFTCTEICTFLLGLLYIKTKILPRVGLTIAVH